MYKLVSADAWRLIKALSQKAAHRSAAIAYVTQPEWLKLSSGDTLVVDASNEAIKTGKTSYAALRTYFDKKVNVYSLPNLHAKIAVLGDHAVIGSTNVSHSSAQILVEAALITDLSPIVGQTEAMIKHFASSKKARLLDEGELLRLKKIRVVRSGGKGGKPPPDLAQDPGSSRLWFMGVWDAPYKGDQSSQQKIQTRLSNKLQGAGEVVHVFLPSRTRIARVATVGDTILIAWRPEKNGTALTKAYMPARLVQINQDGKTTNFYLLSRADAPEPISWKQLGKLAKRAGVRKPLTNNGIVELSPDDAIALESLWPR